eukprot:6203574-Pleurochrysis_carterae.AAC.2
MAGQVFCRQSLFFTIYTGSRERAIIMRVIIALVGIEMSSHPLSNAGLCCRKSTLHPKPTEHTRHWAGPVPAGVSRAASQQTSDRWLR